jgi:gamma-glutamylaminecyclotransferase
MAKPEFVFVYGTLKRGYGNNSRCLSNSTFVGEAVSALSNFEMRRIGFPIIWEIPEGGAKVSGEIFEISAEDMAACDRLEGHPQMYKRELREFVTSDGKRDKAWVYLWQGERKPGYSDPIEAKDGVLTWAPERHDPMPADDADDEDFDDEFDQSEADSGEDYKA